MKTITSFLFCFLVFGTMKVQAQAPDWQWAVQSADQGDGNVTPLQMAIDPSGNIYLLGQFDMVAILGDSTFSNPKFLGAKVDMFLVKYNSEGKVLWAKHPAGHVNFYHSAMAIDSAGSVYFGGIADSIIDFGKGISVDTGSFIAKYDSAGTPRWAMRMGTAIKTDTTFFYSADIAALGCDNRNQLYAVLNLHDSAELNRIRIPRDTNYPFAIALINSDGNVQRMQPELIKGVISEFQVDRISIANNVETSTIYLTGNIISDTVYFDKNLFVRGKLNSERYQAFLARYEMNGCAWVRNVDRQDKYYAQGGPSGICSSGGSLYVTGGFVIDSLNFTDTINYITESFQYYGFLAKYDDQGTLGWIDRFWSLPAYLYRWDASINTSGISVDPQGNAYVSGIFKTTMEIVGDTLFLQSPQEPGNLFEAKFDMDGNSLWVQQAGGGPVSTMQAFYGGNPYLGGYFDGSMTLGNFQLSRTEEGIHTLFLAKLGNIPSAVHSNSKTVENNFRVFPNPASRQVAFNFTLVKSGSVILDIFDLLGRQVKKVSLGEISAGEHSESLDILGIPTGAYICRIMHGDEISSQIFTVIK